MLMVVSSDTIEYGWCSWACLYSFKKHECGLILVHVKQLSLFKNLSISYIRVCGNLPCPTHI
jgi:hypothetical protein